MNVQTITMVKAEAQQAFRDYREAFRRHGEARDAALMRGYRALAKGKQVIDLAGVMKVAGTDSQERPALAVVRADAEWCYLFRQERGVAVFHMDRRYMGHESRRFVRLPEGTFVFRKRDSSWGGGGARAKTPLIPAKYRPAAALSNYHLLWEADWEDVPQDPMLLRRLDGMLFAVLAVWDLTPLERAVLRR